MKTKYYSSYRGMEKKEVYVLRIAEGKGTEDDIVRIITYYLDKDFNIIFKIDPEIKNEQQ